jgi:Protein of unknown function (DUF3631)
VKLEEALAEDGQDVTSLDNARARKKGRKPAPAEDGAALLTEVLHMLKRYVVFPSWKECVAVTLYAAATHAAHRLQFGTRLVIRSPEKRCGKSRLLDILVSLVARPLPTVNISVAALVHSITEQAPPTLILDEADTVFGKGVKGDEKSEILRGMLNAGFGRGAPYLRWDMTARELEECPTFAMAILAGIGSMPDTIEDRAVVIPMRRKAPDEAADRYRLRRDKPDVDALGARLGKWVMPKSLEIADATPDMPDGLNDRQEDAWEALIAVADLAGGNWPQWARDAARQLCGAAEDKAASQKRLLADLREVFDARPGKDKLRTSVIISALCQIEEAPWSEFSRGDAITDRQLAGLLREYEVKPHDIAWQAPVRDNEGRRSKDKDGATVTERRTARGYFRADLADLWTRYLAADSLGVSATSATAATPQVSPVADEK